MPASAASTCIRYQFFAVNEGDLFQGKQAVASAALTCCPDGESKQVARTALRTPIQSHCSPVVVGRSADLRLAQKLRKGGRMGAKSLAAESHPCRAGRCRNAGWRWRGRRRRKRGWSAVATAGVLVLLVQTCNNYSVMGRSIGFCRPRYGVAMLRPLETRDPFLSSFPSCPPPSRDHHAPAGWLAQLGHIGDEEATDRLPFLSFSCGFPVGGPVGSAPRPQLSVVSRPGNATQTRACRWLRRPATTVGGRDTGAQLAHHG